MFPGAGRLYDADVCLQDMVEKVKITVVVMVQLKLCWFLCVFCAMHKIYL